MRARRWSTGLLVASTLSLLPTGSFTLDGGASRVTFFVNDNCGGFAGLAPDVSAQAEVREQDGTFSADVTVRIDARSITTGSGLRDGQMRREFLRTDEFPEITFRGTVIPVEPVTQLSFRADVTGRLTMRGVTREVAFPVRVTALRDSYLVDGTTTIRMTDFTIPIPRFLIFVAEDPVQVTLKLRFRASDQK